MAHRNGSARVTLQRRIPCSHWCPYPWWASLVIHSFITKSYEHQIPSHELRSNAEIPGEKESTDLIDVAAGSLGGDAAAPVVWQPRIWDRDGQTESHHGRILRKPGAGRRSGVGTEKTRRGRGRWGGVGWRLVREPLHPGPHSLGCVLQAPSQGRRRHEEQVDLRTSALTSPRPAPCTTTAPSRRRPVEGEGAGDQAGRFLSPPMPMGLQLARLLLRTWGGGVCGEGGEWIWGGVAAGGDKEEGRLLGFPMFYRQWESDSYRWIKDEWTEKLGPCMHF